LIGEPTECLVRKLEMPFVDIANRSKFFVKPDCRGIPIEDHEVDPLATAVSPDSSDLLQHCLTDAVAAILGLDVDVLEIQAAIVNLYITAPDVSMQTSARTKVYTSDAGHMTLIMQLHDSVTGQLLARAYDHRDSGPDMWQWTNSVTNTAEARRIIATWATALRKALDASRANGANPATSSAQAPAQSRASMQEKERVS
jgi:hypothetical protein